MLNLFQRSLLRKPRTAFKEGGHGLERNLSLWDLLAVGIGGTVGSGVFVLAGMIAREYSGPAVVFSFLIAGFSCFFSACSYGELSTRIPSAGSSYAYVFVGLGEYFAVIAAWCLSLEYGISGAAVARSWGDKLTSLVCQKQSCDFLYFGGINVLAGVLQFTTVIVLLCGIEVGKYTVNAFTIFKVALVIFMIICGLLLFDARNIPTWAPMGATGVMRGATSCFFGYVGYDEVCCMAAEAKNPQRNLPLAVFGTIFSVTIMYGLASLSLVGMQSYQSISAESGFSEAFRSQGVLWAADFVAIGEICSLPLVVLVSFLAQPRLQFAMAEDGLLPKMFSEVDSKGNLTKGILLSGFVCTLIALFVPFTYLDDMISAGVLVSFNLTNSALIVVRLGDSPALVRVNPLTGGLINWSCPWLLCAFHGLCICGSISMASAFSSGSVASFFFLSLFGVGLMIVATAIYTSCPEGEDKHKDVHYRVPFMPFTPLFGIVINYVLLAQLTMLGILLMMLYFLMATAFYFTFGIYGNDAPWKMQLLNSYRDANEQARLGDADREYSPSPSTSSRSADTYRGESKAYDSSSSGAYDHITCLDDRLDLDSTEGGGGGGGGSGRGGAGRGRQHLPCMPAACLAHTLAGTAYGRVKPKSSGGHGGNYEMVDSFKEEDGDDLGLGHLDRDCRDSRDSEEVSNPITLPRKLS